MKNCKFINELNRLRKSSSDSIDNVEKFDQFKSYMHVVRKMEEDLKGLLRKVNASGKKTLVLLCGSAGDGKSVKVKSFAPRQIQRRLFAALVTLSRKVF